MSKMMKKFFTVLTIALSIMQLHAQQTEIRRSEYRIMDDDLNFKNVVQLEIGGRYFYDIDENIHVRFNDAGHMLGSSIIEVWVNEDGKQIKYFKKGDINLLR